MIYGFSFNHEGCDLRIDYISLNQVLLFSLAITKMSKIMEFLGRNDSVY